MNAAPAFPLDARTSPPTHPRWVLRTAPVAPGQFPRSGQDVDAWPPVGSAAPKPLIDENSEFEMPAAGAAGTGDTTAAMDADGLRAVCRHISDIHYQLALAYAMALTFRRAVRDYIPPDDQDILPCLTTGVIDTLDTQLPRLDALLDHLARSAAVPAVRAFRKSTLRHSSRSRVSDASEAAFGEYAAGRAL